MKTLNEIRAARLIAIISKKIGEYYTNLLDLQRTAESLDIQPCKARKIYKDIIKRVVIDCGRIQSITKRYFSESGKMPQSVENHYIFSFDDFVGLVKWFEL